MQNIEKAIRYALERINARDLNKRKLIYQTVWRTHEQNIDLDGMLSQRERDTRRQELLMLLKTIEADYKGDGSPLNSLATFTASAETTKNVSKDPFIEQIFDSAKRVASSQSDSSMEQIGFVTKEVENAMGPEEIASLPYLETFQSRPHLRKRNKRFSKIIFFFLFIVLIVVIWGFYNALRPVNFSSLDLRNMNSSSPMPKNNMSGEQKFVNLLQPSLIDHYHVKGLGAIAIMNDLNGQFVRFTSQKIDDQFIVDLGEGAFASLKNKTAILIIQAKSSTLTPETINFFCNFSRDQSCKRHSLLLEPEKKEFNIIINIVEDKSGEKQLIFENKNIGLQHSIDIYSLSLLPRT